MIYKTYNVLLGITISIGDILHYNIDMHEYKNNDPMMTHYNLILKMLGII